MRQKSKEKTATQHEAKGDDLLAKGKPAKALKEYKKSMEEDAKRPGIYDKLIKAHGEISDEWKMEDFAESVTWTMKKQEQEHPPIKQLHARLSPEWKKATELALDVLYAVDEESAAVKAEQLVAMGEIATRALIGFLMDLKHASIAKPKENGDK